MSLGCAGGWGPVEPAVPGYHLGPGISRTPPVRFCVRPELGSLLQKMMISSEMKTPGPCPFLLVLSCCETFFLVSRSVGLWIILT